MHTIESLESRLAAMNIDELPSRAVADAREQRHKIQEQLARLRLEAAESWSKRDWLDVIEGMIDEIGRLVDKRVFRWRDRGR